MRERVRQVWPEPQAAAVPARRRLLARLRAWARRDDVAEALSRTSLQAAIAGIAVAAAALVRWLPVQALDPLRASIARQVTRDYPVTQAWRDASRWAAARGGWALVLRDAYRVVDGKIRLWASDLLPPGLAGARVTAPTLPGPDAGPGAAPGTAVPGAGANGAGPDAGAGGASGERDGAEPSGGAQAPAGQPPGLITVERPGPGTPPPGQAGRQRPEAPQDATGEGPARGTVRPVPGRVISAFGWRQRPRGGGEELHEGLDLAAAAGDPVRALRAGVVARVGRDPLVGPFVEIDHGKGLSTRYAPMGRVSVKVGGKVEAGQVLGTVGSPPPGEPGTPHLHLEVRQDGRAVDPAPLLGGGPGV